MILLIAWLALAAIASADGPLLLRVEEAAKVLGLGRDRVYGLVRSGQLTTVRVGARRFVSRHEIERFIDSLPKADP